MLEGNCLSIPKVGCL